MSPDRWYTLAVYALFAGMAAALAVLPARARSAPDSAPNVIPGDTSSGARGKLLGFVAINLAVLAAAWSPPAWHVVDLGAVILATAIFVELMRSVEPLGRWRQPLVAGMLVAGGSYVWLGLASVTWIQSADPAGNLLVFLYLAVAANDAFAQIVGERFGRRRLAPRISPGKTWEGACGGVLAAALIGVALAPVVDWPASQAAAAAALCAIAGTAGDLLASVWKRRAGVDTFGHALGAQGGVADRFDSLLLAAPAFYLWLGWLSR